ncbi:MAG: hypothetical protein ABIT09_07725 [Croceibacterium sp.]
MKALEKRLEELERRMTPEPAKRWHRILQYEDQTQEQAVAAYEAQNGPIGDDNTILRVIISKPGPAPG